MRRPRALRDLIAAATLLAASAAGCGEDQPVVTAGYDLADLATDFDTLPSTRFQVRDSAGVQVIRNGRDGALPAGWLEPREVYRVGVITGPQELELWEINQIAVDAEGNRFVGSSRSGWIRVYDATGAFVREFGRHGDGPGDFRALSRLFLAGDTVVIHDSRLRRTTLFRADGRLVDTWNAVRPGLTLVWPAARGPRGWIAWVVPPPPVGYRTLSVGRSEEAIIATGGLQELQIVDYDRPKRFATLRLFEDTTAAYRFFSHDESTGERLFLLRQHPRYATHERAAPRRPMFVHEVGSGFDAEGRFYVTSPTGYRIDVYDADGRHVRAITRDWRAHPVSPATIDELGERTRGHYDSAFARHRIAEAFAFEDQRELRRIVMRMEARRIDREAEAPLPPLFPPIGGLRVSEDGSFWVQRMDVLTPLEYRLHGFGDFNGWPALPTTWDVFDPAGRFLGPVSFPPRFQLMHVRGTDATGVQKDSLGVEYVVTYRVGGATDRLELRGPAGAR